MAWVQIVGGIVIGVAILIARQPRPPAEIVD
jgi:hypothetical protein